MKSIVAPIAAHAKTRSTTRIAPNIQAMKISERDIERTCTDFLSLDGWRCLKTDPCSDRLRGKGFGEKGMADCLYIRYLYDPKSHLDAIICQCEMPKGCTCSQVLWVEWKRKGGKAADHQKLWHEGERARGALVWVAGEDFKASYQDFVDFYRFSGLLRRKGL